MTLPLTINETLKWLSSLPILMQKSFWWWQCSDRYIYIYNLLFFFDFYQFYIYTHNLPLPPPPYPLAPFSPSLISLMVSVDVRHHVYLLTCFVQTKRQQNTQSVKSVGSRNPLVVVPSVTVCEPQKADLYVGLFAFIFVHELGFTCTIL